MAEHAPAIEADAGRKAETTRRKRLVPRLLTLSIPTIYILLILAWNYFGRNVNPYFSSYPAAIARAAAEMLLSGDLLHAVADSLEVFGYGLLLTIVIGIPFGFAMGRYHALNNVLGPLVTALFVAPREVFVPLLVLWFGLTDMSRIVFVFLSSVFPIIYNVADGVLSVSSTHVDVARAYGASEWQTTREVTLPSIVPYLGIGIKQSVGRGLTGLIAAEFFIGVSGLGGELQVVSALFRLDKAFVVIFTLVLIGYILSRAGDAVEAYLGRWRQTERAY
jgi:ABC-type nitrate/sulfonate/bicarbonate transport system permease component